jgi:predicted acylesterase/phospholipase RssA
MALIGIRDIPVAFHSLYLACASLMTYSFFSRRGLFSLLDAIGLVSTITLPSGETPILTSASPHLTRILPDPQPAVSQKPKVGVVLAGGGGKGAYQIGCWTEMRRRGLTIDAIAGTSVGALNVAMVARGDVQNAEDIWSHLSASQLVQFDLASLPFLPFVFARYRKQYVGDRPVVQTVALGLSLLSMAFLAWLLQRFVLFALTNPGYVGYVMIGMLALATVLIMLTMGLDLIDMFSSRPELLPQASAFRTNRLTKLIETLVPAGSFVDSPIESYVTTAFETKIFDPADRLHTRKASNGFMRRRTMKLAPRLVYQPRYLRLDEVERKGGIRLVYTFLKLSSALPIVFPVMRLDGAWIADGGLADNVPIRPLLDGGCTRIFVIHLGANGSDTLNGQCFNLMTKEGLLAKLQQQKRLQRLEDYYLRTETFLDLDALNEIRDLAASDPLFNKDRKEYLTAEIIHVVPSASLGSFLTGTLNFTARKARWLMRLGRQDMAAVLDELHIGADSVA